MKKTIILLVSGILLLASCKKDSIQIPVAKEPCLIQTGNPSGRTYTADSVQPFTCTGSHCGILPLNTRNYWVYEDSVFNNGVFQKVQYDTLRFTSTLKTLSDGLVWWESNIAVGLPEKLYANDSTLFKMENRMFASGFIDAKKEYGLFTGDSLRYLSGFEDAAAIARSLKTNSVMTTPAGDFSGYLYFEKNARNYRKDQVFFQPGIGVIRYVREMAAMGSPLIKLQQVSTLVSYHLE
ncbi:MAG: hypothetical protein HYZ15_15815 [Sphingobacteriales bacterium]|nr:hypothetical protein [Sphingobacteriales bacterium]